MFVAAIDYPPTSHLNQILFNTDISMSDNKIAVSLFWTKVNEEDASCRQYRCRLCKIVRKQNKSGYTNLVDHLNDKHKNWGAVIKNSKLKTNVKGAMDSFLKPRVDEKYKNIYKWLNWVVKCKFPFNFVENKLSRKYSKLNPVCRKTLNTCMEYTRGSWKKLGRLLPNSFGGIFDGWTCPGNTISRSLIRGPAKTELSATGCYAAEYKTFQTTRLAQFGFSAADIGDYNLNSALLRYKKSFEKLEFLTGDYCSVNKRLVDGITDWYRTNKGIQRVLPLNGCASHSLNFCLADNILCSLMHKQRLTYVNQAWYKIMFYACVPIEQMTSCTTGHVIMLDGAYGIYAALLAAHLAAKLDS